ncbi:hypothetical protein T31B1_14655 [Salinisphaera sp. T31B1]
MGIVCLSVAGWAQADDQWTVVVADVDHTGQPTTTAVWQLPEMADDPILCNELADTFTHKPFEDRDLTGRCVRTDAVVTRPDKDMPPDKRTVLAVAFHGQEDASIAAYPTIEVCRANIQSSVATWCGEVRQRLVQASDRASETQPTGWNDVSPAVSR